MCILVRKLVGCNRSADPWVWGAAKTLNGLVLWGQRKIGKVGKAKRGKSSLVEKSSSPGKKAKKAKGGDRQDYGVRPVGGGKQKPARTNTRNPMGTR